MGENIEIEKAKAWFVFAQILIILSGFMFASFGIAYTSTYDNFNRAVNLATQNYTDLNLTLGLIQVYGDLTQSNLHISICFLIFGFIFFILSIIMWITGNNKLKRIE